MIGVSTGRCNSAQECQFKSRNPNCGNFLLTSNNNGNNNINNNIFLCTFLVVYLVIC